MQSEKKEQSLRILKYLNWLPICICIVIGLLFLFGLLPLEQSNGSIEGQEESLLENSAPPEDMLELSPTLPLPTAPLENTPPAVLLGKPAGMPETRYEIAAVLSDEHSRFTGQMRVAYKNTTPDILYELVFHLPANAFLRSDSPGSQNEAQTYIEGFQKGGMVITDVSLNGKVAFYRLSEESMRLHIPFVKELLPGETAEAFISFVLDVPARNARYGKTALGYQLGNCWPLLAVYQDGNWVLDGYAPWGDPFYSQAAQYSVALSYPDTFRIACTGNIISEEIRGGMRTTYLSGSGLREFACMLTKDMLYEESMANGIRLRAFALSEISLLKSVTFARDFLDVYTAHLGEYPYETLTITQAELGQGSGMEYPGMIFVQRSLYLPENEQMLPFTIAHELAHQWFYGFVGNDQINAPWLDESFAAYLGFLPLLPMENRNVNIGAEELKEYYLGERAGAGGAIDGALADYQTEHAYVDSVYWRGAAMLEALQEELGDVAFFAGIKAYLLRNAFGIATKADVVDAFSSASGRDLAPWFESWLKAPASSEEPTAPIPEDVSNAA